MHQTTTFRTMTCDIKNILQSISLENMRCTEVTNGTKRFFYGVPAYYKKYDILTIPYSAFSSCEIRLKIEDVSAFAVYDDCLILVMSDGVFYYLVKTLMLKTIIHNGLRLRRSDCIKVESSEEKEVFILDLYKYKIKRGDIPEICYAMMERFSEYKNTEEPITICVNVKEGVAVGCGLYGMWSQKLLTDFKKLPCPFTFTD